jgi:hypothetical protein
MVCFSSPKATKKTYDPQSSGASASGRRLRDSENTEEDPDDPELADEGDVYVEYSFD